MKILFIVLFIMLLVGLHACVPTKINEITTTDTTTTTVEQSESLTTKIEDAEVTKAEIKTNEKDPYSFFVKDINDDSFSQYLNSGSDYLATIEHHYYALYDLNGDGTEELLWGNSFDDTRAMLTSDYRRHPEAPSITEVYTIRNNAVVQLKGLQWLSGEISPYTSLLKNGVIKMESLNNWESLRFGLVSDEIGKALSYSYYRLENGDLEEIIRLIVDDKGRHWRYDDPNSFDRTRITKKKFESLRQECEGDGQLMELDWRPLAEYGR